MHITYTDYIGKQQTYIIWLPSQLVDVISGHNITLVSHQAPFHKLNRSFTCEKQITVNAQHGTLCVNTNHQSFRLGPSAKPDMIKLACTVCAYHPDIEPFLFFRCYSGQLLMSGPWYPCQRYSVWTGFLHRIHSVIWLWFWLQTQPWGATSMWKEPLVEPPITYMWW